MKDTEVIVQKAWLEGLLEYSDRVKNQQDDLSKRMEVASLLGYIESAKFILRNYEK